MSLELRAASRLFVAKTGAISTVFARSSQLTARSFSIESQAPTKVLSSLLAPFYIQIVKMCSSGVEIVGRIVKTAIFVIVQKYPDCR